MWKAYRCDRLHSFNTACVEFNFYITGLFSRIIVTKLSNVSLFNFAKVSRIAAAVKDVIFIERIKLHVRVIATMRDSAELFPLKLKCELDVENDALKFVW